MRIHESGLHIIDVVFIIYAIFEGAVSFFRLPINTGRSIYVISEGIISSIVIVPGICSGAPTVSQLLSSVGVISICATISRPEAILRGP
jgi:hypothetical protein